MLLQPGLELAVCLDPVLQRLERFHARRQVCIFSRLLVERGLALAPIFFELRQPVLKLMQASLRHL